MARHHGAADPGDGGLGPFGIETEDLDRFAAAVIDHVESVDAAVGGTQIETVRRELAEVWGARTIPIGGLVELQPRIPLRKEHLGGVVLGVDQIKMADRRAAARKPTGYDPMSSGNLDEILGVHRPADKAKLPGGIAGLRSHGR